MLEIILLIFLTRNIGNIALQKGEKPLPWKILTVLMWIICEVIGTVVGILLFGFEPSMDLYHLIGFLAFALASAFGGYLIIRAILTNKPDVH